MRASFIRVLLTFVAGLFIAPAGWATFTSDELILPVAGSVIGAGGENFVTTVWVSNPTSSPASFQMQFLSVGQANTNPPSVTDTLQPGQTKTYENIAETVFNISGRLGAVRVDRGPSLRRPPAGVL